MKVGGPAELDVARARLVRSQIGDQRILMMDANQIWDVPEAIERMRLLAPFDPYWIEEPTSPDDVLGHLAIARAIAPITVATGEMAQNRVIFKQLLASGAIGACQIDACRLGGVNEVLAVLLLAAKFGVPVCPHAGGVGLCEYVQHLSAFDQIAIAPSLDGRLHRVRGSPARALRESGDGRERRLPATRRRGLRRRDARGERAGASVPGRRGVALRVVGGKAC